MLLNVLCYLIVLGVGTFFLCVGVIENEFKNGLFGLILIVIAIMSAWVNDDGGSPYISAEPIAYNSTQTVFTTDKGNIIVNGVYPDGEYLLDMDGDTVLVVWQAVEGEEVGLG